MNTKEMPLSSHLEELRKRLFFVLVWVFIFFAVSFFYGTELILFFKKPLILALPGNVEVLHFTGPMDVLLAEMKAAFTTSIVLSCPFWLFQLWTFLAPGLYENEKKYLIPGFIASIGLFFLGVGFAFYGILPMSLSYLLAIGSEVGTPMITISDYMAMVMGMLLGFGWVFETPLVLILLSSMGILNSETLAKSRRYMILLSLVIGAILTPPDVFSQMAMAIPLYGMFEISLLLIKGMEKSR